MRAILILPLLVFASLSRAETPFDNWQVFPGPNPEAADIISNWEGGPTFRIGHIIFAYDSAVPWPIEERGVDLDKLPPVANVIRAVRPTTGLKALASSQYGLKFEFFLESATLHSPGGDAWGWWVEWHLFPASGGSTGTPPLYTTVITAKNDVVHPDCYVFDAYRLHAHEWLCSTLKVPESVAVDAGEIAEDDARQIAMTTLSEFTRRMNARERKDDVRMELVDVQQVQIPLPWSNADPPESAAFWAVNFTSEAQSAAADDAGYRFTFWVSADGRTSELKLLGVGPGAYFEVLNLPDAVRDKPDGTPNATSVVTPHNADHVLELLQAMPSWSDVEMEMRPSEELESAARRIALHDSKVIREALVRHYKIETGPDPDMDDKIFIMNKFLFNLPAGQRDTPMISGSYIGSWLSGRDVGPPGAAPGPDDDRTIRWPW